jgi:hypothetical protein
MRELGVSANSWKQCPVVGVLGVGRRQPISKKLGTSRFGHECLHRKTRLCGPPTNNQPLGDEWSPSSNRDGRALVRAPAASFDIPASQCSLAANEPALLPAGFRQNNGPFPPDQAWAVIQFRSQITYRDQYASLSFNAFKAVMVSVSRSRSCCKATFHRVLFSSLGMPVCSLFAFFSLQVSF